MFTNPVKDSSYLHFLLKHKYKLYESAERSNMRQTALRKLIAVANEWASTIAKKKGATDDELKQN